jgi:hypothetical protein
MAATAIRRRFFIASISPLPGVAGIHAESPPAAGAQHD